MDQSNRLLAAVKALASARDMLSIQETVRFAARELLVADGVALFLREGEDCRCVEENAIAPLGIGKRFPLSACAAGWVLLQKQPLVAADIDLDARIPKATYQGTFVRSLAMVPVCPDEPVAVIAAYWAGEHEASGEEMTRLMHLADAVGIALNNVRLHQERDKSDTELQKQLERLMLQERERKQLADRLQRVFACAATGIVLMDWSGRILQCNPAMCAMLGYSEAELTQMKFHELIRPEDRAANLEQIRLLQSGAISSFQIENRYLHRAGHEVWGRKFVSVLPADHEEASQMLTLVTDIDERKRAEDALRITDERFRVAVGAINGAVWDYDLASGRVWWSQTCDRLFLQPVNTTGTWQQWINRLHPEDRERVISSLRSAQDDASREWSAEYRIQAVDSSWVCVLDHACIFRDANGKATRILGAIIDITARKQVEEALAKSRERMEMILSGGDLGTWDWDVSSGAVVVNRRWYEMLGYQEGEIPTNYEYWISLLHPDDRSRVQKLLQEHFDSGETYKTEFRMQHKSGSWCWISSQGKVLQRDAAGKPLRMCGTHQDVTHQKVLEENLRQAEKLDAIGQLAGGVAHELNNQLSGVMGYAELIETKTASPDLLKYVRGILASADHAANLVKQLLAFSRKGISQSVPVDLHLAIMAVVEILQHTIDRRIVIQQEFGAEQAVTCGDPLRIQNALLNLGLNARDAMPKGGTLSFASSLVTFDDAGCASAPFQVSPGHYVRICVTDTGCGIPPDVMAHIFEPFFTTKEFGKGSGMGLPAVYGTVKEHGGAIHVASQPGGGTSVALYFLLLAERAHLEQTAAEPAAQHNARILVVDDEEMCREAMSAILAHAGYQVLTAKDGAVGVALYREHWRELELVILDMIMPQMDGKDAFLAMKALNPDIACLMASGFSASDNVEAARSSGICGVIQKPFTKAQLLAAVSQVMRTAKAPRKD